MRVRVRGRGRGRGRDRICEEKKRYGDFIIFNALFRRNGIVEVGLIVSTHLPTYLTQLWIEEGQKSGTCGPSRVITRLQYLSESGSIWKYPKHGGADRKIKRSTIYFT